MFFLFKLIFDGQIVKLNIVFESFFYAQILVEVYFLNLLNSSVGNKETSFKLSWAKTRPISKSGR